MTRRSRHRAALRQLRALETKYGETSDPASAKPGIVERRTARMLRWLFSSRRLRRLAKARARADALRATLANLAAARQRRAVAKENQKARERMIREHKREAERAIEAEIAALKAEGDELAAREQAEREALRREINSDRRAALRAVGGGLAQVIIVIFAGFGFLFFVALLILALLDKHR